MFEFAALMGTPKFISEGSLGWPRYGSDCGDKLASSLVVSLVYGIGSGISSAFSGH